MRNVKGFSLLLFLLYLLLFTTITFLFCHVIVSFIIPSFASMRKCQSIIALHVASDLFVRDIHAIKSNQDWKKITSQELIWHTNQNDIGWCFMGNQLIRHMGIYDKQWKQKTTSIVATGIGQGVFTVEKAHNTVVEVTLSITPIVAPHKPILCHVAVKGEKNHG